MKSMQMSKSNWLVTIPRGSHPIPFRIRSLSPSGPMVVIPQGIVRVGRCQPIFLQAVLLISKKVVPAALICEAKRSKSAGTTLEKTIAAAVIGCRFSFGSKPWRAFGSRQRLAGPGVSGLRSASGPRSSPASSDCDTMPARPSRRAAHLECAPSSSHNIGSLLSVATAKSAALDERMRN